jgi:very-short-patch-repair endonuclease
MEFEIIDNSNEVTCRICGRKSKRLYGGHLKYHSLTSEEYLRMFPGAPLMASSDKEKMGKHMKEDKYKKMFREMYIGERNPNHKINTTEEQRKSRSPFSKDFIKYANIDDKENVVSNFAKEALKDRVSPLQKEYYLLRGHSEEDSLKMLSSRQSTFSLEKCIEKHGKEEGTKVYTDRQNKWQKSLLENGNLKYGFSSISQELFYSIISEYTNKVDIIDVYFATKNGEFRLNRVGGSIWIYDFVDIKRRKIIEYNGDQYHANPSMFSINDTPHPFRTGFTSGQIWKKDADKIKVANDNGFEVLVIWDSEYHKNKKETIKKCLNFLEIK